MYAQTQIARLSWITLISVLVALGAITGAVVNDRFQRSLRSFERSADLQLEQITAVLSSELSHENFQSIDELIHSYLQVNEDIVYMRLVSANGFEIANYRRPYFNPDHVLELKNTIKYSYKGEATIFLGISQRQVFQSQIVLSSLLASIYIIFSSLSIFLHFFAIKSRRAAERADRASMLYKAQSEINHAIVTIKDEGELLNLVCDCAVKYGGMKMAWVAKLDETGERFIPAASVGNGLEYLNRVQISPFGDVAEGRGPTGTAYRENRPYVINNYFSAPETMPWKAEVARHGWASAAAYPISRGGRPYAVLSVYHADIEAFDGDISGLLEELATDVSFALDNFDRETAQRQARQLMKLAASIYDHSSEGMIIIDPQNKVISVNSSFQTITGYRPDEVIGSVPGFLQSSRHDERFYEAMWNEIWNTGKWAGEIWDRNKAGALYPLWVTFDSVFDNYGGLDHRIAVLADISEKKKYHEMLWRNANLDSLTELPNRRLFLDRLDQEIAKSRRNGKSVALLFVDLDRFKEVNDTMGHEHGDQLLIEAARRISSVVRETDTVARLGGDEFTVIVPEYGGHFHLDRICKNMLEVISRPYCLKEGTLAYTSASIGIALYPDDASNRDELMRHADQAMYTAKFNGRNGYSYFMPSMQQDALDKMAMTNDLRYALSNHELEVFYQPIVELKTGSIRKAEALLRWRHPTRGMVSPAVFIPLAEEFGLIHDIGHWAFLQAVASISNWMKSLGMIVQISVNRSPVEFTQEELDWAGVLNTANLPGSSICMEITEGLLVKESTLVQETLMACRTSGIEVSVDDFGTGYSALSYLKRFDVDYLKIDQSFVKSLTDDESDKAMVEAIIVMAHKLGIKTIAEGVETEAQRDLLLSFGCDFAQGYLYSKPIPATDFEKLLGK